MRFLHTADLHLDSAFCSSGTVAAEARREAQRRLLGRIFELARTEGCQMVLIAGDLFDGKCVTPETRKYVCELFAAAKLPIVIAPGNHDPYTEGSFYKTAALPENVYVFSSNELQRFDFPDLSTSVFGYAFTSPTLAASPLAGAECGEDDGNIRLLCAHADLSSPISRYCPLTVGDITRLRVSYAALGHIHNRDIDDSADGSVIRYSGFPEGRSFDELGDGGVFIVDVEAGEPPVYRRALVSAERYASAELDVSGLSDRDAIISEISAVVRRACDRPTHLRLCLTGTADAFDVEGLSTLADTLTGGNVLSLELCDLTIPVPDAASLRQDPSLRGELYRQLYSGLTHEDAAVRERTALALRIGLAAIDGRRIPEGKDGI